MPIHCVPVSRLCQRRCTEHTYVFLLANDLIGICEAFSVCPSASFADLRRNGRTGYLKAIAGVGSAELNRDIANLVWTGVAIPSHAVVTNADATQMKNTRRTPNLNPVRECDFPIDTTPLGRNALLCVFVCFRLATLQWKAVIQLDGLTLGTPKDSFCALFTDDGVGNARHGSTPWIHVVDALPSWMDGGHLCDPLSLSGCRCEVCKVWPDSPAVSGTQFLASNSARGLLLQLVAILNWRTSILPVRDDLRRNAKNRHDFSPDSGLV